MTHAIDQIIIAQLKTNIQTHIYIYVIHVYIYKYICTNTFMHMNLYKHVYIDANIHTYIFRRHGYN